MSKPKVYFTKTITPEKLVEMYDILKKPLKGKVGVKIHSGEQGNKNYLRPEFLKPIVEHVKGTIVECNTAYPGARNYTDKHWKLMEEHEWSKYFKVDILDAEGPDITLKIPHGIKIKENYIGKNTKNYDSILVVSHFKGHAMGGYGGALKQLSIGMGSTRGKTYNIQLESLMIRINSSKMFAPIKPSKKLWQMLLGLLLISSKEIWPSLML